ncbi:MAG TPA: BON domain-containing protein [Deltaproteobacteria bacterium]|jgi:osmotically-inducible protein OsmY|nr:BON domain-containing protein [Deltaproteobacteria bacterium]HPX51243.1 BON domain-containing protein [Deltaproteobacteria bacterium]HQA72459.1 BON domain-containing protein [Deltaproteobacteria bacterium]HQO81554.1 BON domain-containing protein [Deltaproteobacteria bacterium]HQQ14113.1 BON domain-containing protein [Deltaproteobacteria bacterium]
MANKRSAEDIKKDVYSQLVWDNRVGNTNIVVDVTDDGTVILTGMVANYADRSEAEEDAYSVTGVRYVDNRLTVTLPPSFPVPGDDDIAAQIERLLEWNPTVNASGIRVIVTKGILTLTGNVDSIWQKRRAEELAEHIAGVIGVENQLTVRPVGGLSDEEIRSDILGTIARNTFIDAPGVEVGVENGTVILSGIVDNYMTYRTILDIANNTNGVIEVRSELAITGYR